MLDTRVGGVEFWAINTDAQALGRSKAKGAQAKAAHVAGEEEHAEETICSLKFGERMAIVRNSPTVVVDSCTPDPSQLQAMVEMTRVPTNYIKLK